MHQYNFHVNQKTLVLQELLVKILVIFFRKWTFVFIDGIWSGGYVQTYANP